MKTLTKTAFSGAKKSIALILALLMLITTLPLTASAATEYTEGYYTYSVSNGKATIEDVDESISGDIIVPSTLGGYPVTVLGWNAFAYCDNITSVIIPNSVTSIGYYSFRSCEKLTKIIVDDNNEYFSNDADGVLFNKNKTTIIKYPSGKTNITYTIPDTVTYIHYHAFENCPELTSIIIPKSVTSIDSQAFNACENLTSVIVDDKNLYYSSNDDGILFNKNKTTIVYYPFGKSNKTYTIPSSVITIGDFAFYCTSLTNITIPSSVHTIAKNAFAGCASLTSITIPESVVTIGQYAFSSCYSLTSITIPNSVTSIDFGAFSFCNKLEYITLSNSLTYIVDYTFYSCQSLKSIIIPDYVKSIGWDAFDNCHSLTSITIPKSVTSIAENAFTYSKNITDVYYTGTESEWNNISIGSGNEPLFNATIHFNGGETETETKVIKDKLDNVIGVDYTFTYSDEYFSESSYEYNHDLAIMSNCLAVAAMTSDIHGDLLKAAFPNNTKLSDTFILKSEQSEKQVELINEIHAYSANFSKKEKDMTEQEKAEKNKAWQNLINSIQTKGYTANEVLMASFYAGEFFNKIGFENPVHYNYMNVPQMNSIACVIANKKIGESTVIAIGVRGAGYGAEWGGNFNVGTAEEHEGFRIAKEKVLNYLSDYIKNNNITGDVKFWISGYSRAAATSNLVAAALDEGAKGYDYITALDYDPDDVFAYTFETPIPTKDKNTKNALYTNIFNIINRIDYVPKVAPETWGYSRYGVDCFLPSPETYGSKEYDTLLKKMKTQHKNITGKKYTENFTFYDAKFSVNTNGILNTGFDVSFVSSNGNVSQSRYLDEFISIIAKCVLKDPQTFTNQYQSSVQKLMVSLLGGGFEEVDIPENTKTEIMSALFEGVKSIIFNTKNMSWRYTLAGILSSLDSFNLTYTDAYNLLGIVDEALVTGAVSYNYVYTLLENASAIKPAHYPDMNFAWVTALDGQTIKKSIGGITYRVIKYNCPIDIKLYDENDNLLATICGDNIEIAEDCYLSIYIDADGQKCFCLPEDTQYRFEITGTDEGTMNCSFSEYDFTKGTNTEIVNYFDIPVKENATFIVEVESKNVDDNNEKLADAIVLTNERDEIIESDEIIEADEMSEMVVTVVSDSEISAAIGGGIYEKGEFAKVEALADSSEVFAGWYINDELISTESTYRFKPEGDCTIVAKWNPCCSDDSHIASEWIIDKNATCTKEGSKHIECTVCEVIIKTEAVPKLAHNYNSVVTEATCETGGYTTYTCSCGDSYIDNITDIVDHKDDNRDEYCDYCDKFLGVEDNDQSKNCSHMCHKSGFMGFIWKIIRFFSKLFGANPVCECGAQHY